jgi:signal transduction histidine kinase
MIALNTTKHFHRENRAERRVSLLLSRVTRALERKCHETEYQSHEMGRLHRTLVRLSAALRERDRERLIHLATAVHDLKSPLMVVAGAAWMLRKEKEKMSPEERDNWLDSISRQATTLEFLVGDLLDEARSDLGHAPRCEDVDLCRLARELVGDFASVTHTHTVHFSGVDENETDNCDCTIKGDPEALKRLLFNLVSNAVKYSDAGRDVCVSVWRRDDSVLLLVEDEGCGIAPTAKNERLFGPFVRLEESRHMANGDGLGLASVKRIAEAHNAKISVQGVIGRGTTFEVRFPAPGGKE